MNLLDNESIFKEQILTATIADNFPKTPYDLISLLLGKTMNHASSNIFIIVILIIIVFVIVKTFSKKNQKTAAHTAVFMCQSLTRDHIRALLLKKRQMQYNGDYGEIFDRDFTREIEYFLLKIVHPKILNQLDDLGDPNLIGPSRVVLIDIIKFEITKFEEQDSILYSKNLPDDPLEFERWCIDQLRESGWDARPTKASGDQGADVIASKRDLKIVVQCKLYAKPVGNKAVQEVSAARKHYDAQRAVVVCTSGYTKSAKQLANTNDVLLLHAFDLATVETQLIN